MNNLRFSFPYCISHFAYRHNLFLFFFYGNREVEGEASQLRLLTINYYHYKLHCSDCTKYPQILQKFGFIVREKNIGGNFLLVDVYQSNI